MDELETRELRYFVAVAEELNFSRAARRLNMAQPPLSKAIRGIEGKLGVALLHRNTRKVELTDAGAVLLAESRKALDAVAAATRKTLRAKEKPELIVGMKPDGDGGLLHKIIAEYAAERLPPARVRIGGVGDEVAMLRDGRADVAVLREPFDSAGLDWEPLASEPRMVALAASHPLAHRRRLRLADVRAEPVPRWRDNGCANADVIAYWTGRDSAPGTPPASPGPEVDGIDQLLEVIRFGQGIAFLPASIEHRHPRCGVVYRPMTGLSSSRVVVAWQQQSRSPAVAAFVRAAVDVAANEIAESDGAAVTALA
ncbi:MAG: LysR family transcriptional regulator [Sciscionella sp.]|nr:LysR family transcriptional regulator [Sciscionella sp.]